VELKYLTPWIRSISDTQLSAVRVTIGVPALSHANTTNGDITGWGVGYTIAISTDGGAFAQVYSGSISGKTTTKYQRSHRLDLPAATTGWQIRVSRTSANGNSSAIADTTTIDSYTEIVDAKLRYPNSALVGVMGDASQFSNIPSRSYDCWGRIIKVPSNYDPQSRVYTGTWDGTFKPAWTDNPAWVFYDLVLHSRYGLGHLVSAA
jgi:predicted phage tail protein